MDWLKKQFRSVMKRARPVIVGAATGGPAGAVGGLLAGAEVPEGSTDLMEPVIAAVLAGQITTGQALLAGGLAIVGIVAGGWVGYAMGEDQEE